MNLRSTLHRCLNAFRRQRADVDAELHSHLELHIEDNVARGMSPDEARRHALLKLGGLEQTKELVHEQHSLPLLETLLQDTRFAFRILKKSPGFAAVAVLTLALGIGANTAIFSIMREVLLRRLPVPHPEQLVLVYSPGLRDGHVSSDEVDGSESFSYPMYVDLRDRNTVFSGLAAKADYGIGLTLHGQTDRGTAQLVSGNFFSTLGVRPALGRLIEPEDARFPGSNPVAVLSFAFWQDRLGRDPSILNQSILVNGHPMTVVGVVQPGFDGIQPGKLYDVYLPITMRPVLVPGSEDGHHLGLMNHNDYWVKVIGRLKPGLSREQASAALAPAYSALLAGEVPLNDGLTESERKEFAARQIILRDGSRGRPMLAIRNRSPLFTLMGMVALVLLITCANVAGLLTARGAARQKEIGIRFSLGASRSRLVRQLMLESCLLSFSGAILGLFLARWLAAALVTHLGGEGLSASLNLPVLLFTIALALLCGIFFGVAPAVSATRVQIASTLKNQSASVSSTISHARFRKALVVSQFALTLLLVTVACGFVRSLYNLKNVDLGFRSDHVLLFSIAPALNGYDNARSLIFFSQLEQKLAALPGVHSVSSSELRVIDQEDRSSNFTFAGQTGSPDLTFNCVGPGYFSGLGVPLVEGREFASSDDQNSPKVAIVNETLAEAYFPGGRALGKLMKFGGGSRPLDTQIVGIVRNSRQSSVNEDPRPFVYVPYRQRTKGIESLTFYVRTASNPSSIASAVRSTVSDMDAALPVYNVRTFEEQIDKDISSSRLLAILALCFGALAALLAALGIYALLAYTVAERTREIGVRMALGADPARVAWMVLSDVGRLTALGIVLGIPLAYACTRFINSMLFNVRAFSILGVFISLLALGAIATLAAFLPARRASRVDPILALRYE